MKLTHEERSAIFAGSRRALRRIQKPEFQPGEKLVLSWSRGGRQFVGRSHEERLKTSGATIEVPRKPTVWIELGEVTTKIEDGKTVWLVQFEAHDERERVRTLAALPGPPREAGLKTRWNETVDASGETRPSAPTPKGRQSSPPSDDAARGYGGGGKSTVDEQEGVDDATLNDFARRLAQENEMRQRQKLDMAERMREERKLKEEWRKGKPGKLRQAQIERQSRRLDAA